MSEEEHPPHLRRMFFIEAKMSKSDDEADDDVIRLAQFLEIEIDWMRIANKFGPRAMNASNGRITALNGTVIIRFVKRRRRHP